MNLNNFEQQIDSVILDRGMVYFMNGAVDDPEEIEPGRWFASVYGSDVYSAEVVLDEDDQITDWHCSCPYDHGPVCKHVAALLYTLSKITEDHDSVPVRGKDNKTGRTNFQEIVEKVSKDDLWTFILEGMKSDPMLKNRFIAHFADHIQGDDPQQKYRDLIKGYYKQAIQQSGYGYIDYPSAPSFTRPLYELSEKADQLLARGKMKESLAICKSLIEEVSGILDTIDDSDGSAGDVITFSFDTLSRLITEPGFKEKEELFDWCLAEYSKSKYDDFGLEHHFLHLLPELVNRTEQEDVFFELIDKKIEEVKRSNYPEYGIKNLVRAKVDYFKRSGRDKEAEELIGRYNHIAEFREMQVESALESGNTSLAKELCLEGIKIGKKEKLYGNVSRWHELLFRIAKLQEDVSEIRKYAEILFFENHHSMEWYRQLKAIWPSVKWPKKCEEIIDRMKGNDKEWWRWRSDSLASIYIEEGYTDRLLRLARLNSDDIRFIRQYAGRLADDYPGEILEFYENAIKKFTEQTGRKYYKEAARYLKEMSEFKGGEEKAHLLCKELLQTYNNRPAMKDEFQKKFPAWV